MLFGQSLQQLLSISLFAGNTGLPDIVRKFTNYLKTKVDVEDIFSDDFDSPELEDLRSLLETASESVEFETESPRQVAALFKRFIHDLPKPLIKASTLTMFMISDDLPQEEIFYAIRGHLQELPGVSLKVLQELIPILARVVDSPSSKMTLARIGAAWATSLFPTVSNGTASEKESAAKLIGNMISWYQLLFADLDVVIQRQAEDIKPKKLSRDVLISIWSKKLLDERQQGKTEYAVALTTTSAFRLLVESLCSEFPSKEEDINNCRLLFENIMDNVGGDDNTVKTFLTAVEEMGQVALSSEVISSYCFLASILCKDFSSNTIQQQERNINMAHAMLTERKQVDYTAPKSPSKPVQTSGSDDGPVLLAVQALDSQSRSPATSPRTSPKEKPKAKQGKPTFQKAESQPVIPQLPALPPHSQSIPEQKVFRSGWVLNSATPAVPIKPPKPRVRPKSTMNPKANRETEKRLIEELRPKKPSPRISVTPDGEVETIESPKSDASADSPKSSESDSARKAPEEEEYEYEEVYEEVEEWEYEEVKPKKQKKTAKTAKTAKPPPPIEVKSEEVKIVTNELPLPSATHKRRASLPPQPSADLIAPEEKPTKRHTLVDLAPLSSKLEKWGKLIEMYLAQRSLIIQHTKVKDQVHRSLPEHVKTFQDFVKVIKENNKKSGPNKEEPEDEDEQKSDEDEPIQPVVFTPRNISLNKSSIAKSLQSLIREKEMLEKQLQIVNRNIQRIMKRYEQIKSTAIAAIEDILVQAKGGFESTYLALKSSELQNDNRCIDDTKECLELFLSVMTSLKALDGSLMSKDQIDQKVNILRICYKLRLLLQKTLETVKVKERLGEEEQLQYQLQQATNMENEIKKSIEEGGHRVSLDESEISLATPQPSLRSSTERRQTTAATQAKPSTSKSGAAISSPSSLRDSLSASPKPEKAKKDRSAGQMLSKITSLRIGKLDEKTGKKKDEGSKIRSVTGSIAKYSVDDTSALAIAKDQLYETLTSFYSNETPEEKEKRLRSEVVAEFIATETAYLKNLQSAVKYMYEPLKASPIITAEEHTIIFANLPTLIPVTQKLLRQLQGQEDLPTKEQSIGNCFLGMIKDFEVYKEYCSNQGRSQRIRDKLSKRPAFSSFIAEATKSPEFNAEQTTLDALLIQPMQRICRYPLLLNELIKRTPDDHCDKVDSAKALEEVSSIVDSINALRVEDDKKVKLEDMYDSFDTKKDKEPKITLENFVVPSRELLLEGNAKKLKQKGYSGKGQILLFNDLVILAAPGKKLELKAVIPAKKCCVSDVRDNGKVRATFEISNTATKELMTVSFINDAEKKAWMQNIHSVVNHSLTGSALNLQALPK